MHADRTPPLTLLLALALWIVLPTTSSTAHAKPSSLSPQAVMDQFREAVKVGNVKALHAMLDPKRGLKDEGERIKVPDIDQNWLIHRPSMKTARSGRSATCPSRWRGNSARCDLVVAQQGGYSYYFKKTRSGPRLVRTQILDAD